MKIRFLGSIKYVIAFILAVAMITINVTAAYEGSSAVSESIVTSGDTIVSVIEDSIQNTISYSTTWDVDEDHYKGVFLFDNNGGTVTLSIYKNNSIAYENTILNPDFYPEEYGIGDDVEPSNNVKIITEGEEDWWGYKFYYNTDSASGDVYWRLYNPNPDVSPFKKYFFAEHGSDNQSNAMSFMDEVRAMKLAEDQLAVSLTMQTIQLILNGVTLAAAAAAGSVVGIINLIEMLAIAKDMTTTQVEKTATIYHTALMADSYYLDVYDPIVDY